MTVKQIIVMNKSLHMTKGKFIAQGSHASMKFMVDKMQPALGNDGRIQTIEFSPEEMEWLEGSFAKVCVYVNSEEELTSLIEKAREAGIQVCPIVDSGKTMFKGIPTLTCAAFGPTAEEKLNPITGHLKLL